MAEVQFQLDEHLENAIALGLRRQGISALTASQAHTRGTPDPDVLAVCLEAGRVIVTNDDDFLRLDAQGHAHAGIVYWQQRTKTIGEAIEALTLVHEVLQAEEMFGRVQFL